MKEEIIKHYSQIAQSVIAGEISAYPAFGEISTLIKRLEWFEKLIKEQAVKDAEHEEKKFTYFGYTFEKLAPRRVVSYKNVPQWADLKARQERIEKLALTAATQFGATIVDEETGEVIPAAEIKFTNESLSVKLTQ